MFRYEKPVKLFSTVKSLGGNVEKKNDGVYYVSGIINIPTQVVVMGELYDMIRREDPMCEYLRELFKDELIQEREQGIRAFVLDKIEDGFSEKDIVKRLVKRFDLTEDMAEEYVLKYSGVTV